MKKTLVALAVMAVAGSANAGIELYNKDGITVNMKGDVEVRYKKAKTKDAELQQEIDDADFGFDTRYAVNDATQVGFYWEFSAIENDRADTGKADYGDVYVGFYNDQLGTLKVGKLATQLDDAGVGSDHLFGVNSFVDAADVAGDEAIRYDLDKGDFYFGFGLMQDKHNNKGLGEDGSLVDLKVGYRGLKDFDFTGFFGQAKFKGHATKDKQSLAALEARYSGIENVGLEAGFYSVSSTPLTGDKNTDNTFALAADYAMNDWTFAGGFSSTQYDAEGKDNLNTWFVNAGYGIAPSTTAYVEIGGDNDDANEVGYGVGIKASF
ncbi:putative OMPH_PHOPR Porin-like protein H [Vibrio nigripulchritudo SOn1]|uniref:OMPH_PHOPR Porin-like protein H n=1 Tax=Vibrio nigripulchritudo SOn1 TaxID=1238450 RepID=A0AAV2VV24_9VIBR|nr:porin [Vibrio nigripulchritudo]CCO48328.1 putative OMPH_PHOPR Porin-like protein H [Vibrio nigripulchritudo SOn1]